MYYMVLIFPSPVFETLVQNFHKLNFIFQGFTLVLSVFCFIHAIGSLLHDQLDSGCYIRQLQKSGANSFHTVCCSCSLVVKQMLLFYICYSFPLQLQ